MEKHQQHEKEYIKFAILGAILASVLTGMMLSKGVTLTPDGWAYWEGSVSLLFGNGYEYFGGQNITAFPPLFSAMLSSLQFFTGVNGFSLFLYLITLASLNAFIWIYLFLRINGKAIYTPSVLFVLYISFFTGSYYTALLAETLMLPLLGLSLVVLLRSLDDHDRVLSIRDQLIFGAIVTALLLTKNSNISLLPPYFLVLAFTGRKQRLKRIGVATILTLAPAVFWYLTRNYLQQSGSHPIVFSGNYSLYEYIEQLTKGLSSLIGPDVIGASLLGVSLLIIIGCAAERKGTLIWEDNSYLKLYILLLTIFCSTLFLLILFNLVWINDPLQGRFIWALPITISGALAVLSSRDTLLSRRNAIIVVLVALTLIQVARTSRHIWYRLQSDFQAHIEFHHSINPNYVVGPPLEYENYILLSPPEYSWIKR